MTAKLFLTFLSHSHFFYRTIGKTASLSTAQILGNIPRHHMKGTDGFTDRKSAAWASDQKRVSHSKGTAFTLNGLLMIRTAAGQTFVPTSDSVCLIQSDKHVICPGTVKQAKLYASAL